MPLLIETTNATGQTLAAIIDKVQTTGVDVDPALRYSVTDGQFMETASLTLQDALVDLNESATILGYYSTVISSIDVLTENLRLTIYDVTSEIALGSALSIPLVNVNPEVEIVLNVTEDRS